MSVTTWQRQPDRWAFIDLDSPTEVWGVEVSDERSVCHFITVWTKGDQERHGTIEGHNPDFHRGEDAHTGLMKLVGESRWEDNWDRHFHIPLEAEPVLEDFQGHGIPEAILYEVEQWIERGRTLGVGGDV